MIPNFLKELLTKEYSEEQINEILKSYKENKVVSLRINTIKTTTEEIIKYLEEQNITYETITWSDTALVITNKTENELQELLQKGVTNFIEAMVVTELNAEITLLKHILEI